MGKKLLRRHPAPAQPRADALLTTTALLLHIQRNGSDGRTLDELTRHFDASEEQLQAELKALDKKVVQAFRKARNGHSPKVWRDANYGTR